MRKRKRIKLNAEDVHKNSGKEISHTITKIKEHEKLYTFILVVIFMVAMTAAFLLGFSSDKYQIYDASYYSSNYSLKGQSIILTTDNIMSDEEGLKTKAYELDYSNNTTRNMNYILRFALDEKRLDLCNCRDRLVPFQKIKYSLDGKTVNQFSEEAMIITSGMLNARTTDTLKIHIWIDESLKDTNSLYYGKFVLEQLEDMDD